MQQPAYCPRTLYIGAGLLQRYDGSNGPMWNLLCQCLLSLVSRYPDHPCFLSSLSPGVTAVKTVIHEAFIGGWNMACEQRHKFHNGISSMHAGRGPVLSLINGKGIIRRIKFHSINGNGRPAHISCYVLNCIPISAIYLSPDMDIETGMMIPGHEHIYKFLFDYSLPQ